MLKDVRLHVVSLHFVSRDQEARMSKGSIGARANSPHTVALAGSVLGVLLAHSTLANVDVLIQSDGSNPAVFPNLAVQYGPVLFDVPLAKIFGLDVDNGLQPLPPADRFPGDLFGTLAMNSFLAASPQEHTARGMLVSFGGFNNPSPGTNPQDIAKLMFTLPLLDDAGNPLGGPGRRWIKFQNGPNAGGGGGGGGGAPSAGRAAGWLQPPATPLKVWAGVIKRFDQNPGETEDQFRARVRGAVEEKLKQRGLTRKQIQKYLKLVDDSDYMDPNENWILEVPDTYGAGELQVELAFYIQSGGFLKVAELFNNFSVAITNDPALASTDPNNQPAGEILLDTATLSGGGASGGDGGSGEVVSLMLSDIEVPATTVVTGQFDATLAANSVEVMFHSAAPVEQTGAGTQFLDLFLADGTMYRVMFDQAVGDLGRDIAQDLASTVNVWPHEGAFRFRGVADANRVIISNLDGTRIEFANIIHTNDSVSVEEQLRVGTCIGGSCRGTVLPVQPRARPRPIRPRRGNAAAP